MIEAPRQRAMSGRIEAAWTVHYGQTSGGTGVMVARHDARKQKKAAKLKAKRSEKRAKEHRRDSKDPTIRLQGAEKWPVAQAFVAAKLWEDGIGPLVIARQEGEGRLVFAVFLVDVFCLGVKNAFWSAGGPGDFNALIAKMDKSQKMVPIDPPYLVKLVIEAIDYAAALGFPPHPDYRHASRLLAGIDAAACDHQFTFGYKGKPLYIRGPYETLGVADAISEHVANAGGNYFVPLSDPDDEEIDDIEFDHYRLDTSGK
jgi:hypothetical protein